MMGLSRKLYLVLWCAMGWACVYSGSSLSANTSRLEAVEWRNPVPGVRSLEFDWLKLGALIDNRMMLLVHPIAQYELPGKGGELMTFPSARAVTAFVVIDAPSERVKAVVSGYENYVDFMPRTTSAKVLEQTGAHTLVSYVLNFKIPLIDLDIHYLLQHTEEENGDVSVLMREGDMKGGASRWEFIALGENKTLLMYTNWNDVESVGMVFKSVVKAQPEMKLTSPVLSAALAVEAVQEYFTEGEAAVAPSTDEIVPQPRVPIYKNEDLALLEDLSRVGKVLFIYPAQWVQGEGEVTALKFVTVLAAVQGDLDTVKKMSSEFSRYPEYFRQVVRVREVETEAGKEVDWNFRFGFGIISIPLRYSLGYQWEGENLLRFKRVAGDIDYIVGGLEWVAVDEAKTLSFYTSAIALKESSSWVMNIVKQMPKLAMVGGVSFGIMVLEHQVPWIETLIQGEEYRPSWTREKRRRSKRPSNRR